MTANFNSQKNWTYELEDISLQFATGTGRKDLMFEQETSSNKFHLLPDRHDIDPWKINTLPIFLGPLLRDYVSTQKRQALDVQKRRSVPLCCEEHSSFVSSSEVE
jgi:hypothetical protein